MLLCAHSKRCLYQELDDKRKFAMMLKAQAAGKKQRGASSLSGI
jgi:hypothetical protein